MKSAFHTMSNEDYQKEEAVSTSDLKLFHRSPAHYKVKEHKPPTDPMKFGAAFHTFALQPGLFAKEYAIRPQGIDGRCKEGKDFALIAKKEGKAIVKWDDWLIMKDMKKSLENHSTAKTLLAVKGLREISGFWVDERTSLECRLRTDFILPEGEGRPPIVGDLKTTIDARLEPFMKQLSNLHYHWQGANYLSGVTAITGVEHKDFVIIAIEKEPPYAVAVYRLDSAMIYMGQEELKVLMDEFKECKEKDNWPAYMPDEIQPISLPKWYFQRAEI